MPYEFEDLSKQVAAGTEDVEKGLATIVETAEKADEAYAKFGKTQQESIRIAEKFNKALAKTNKGLTLFRKTETDITRKNQAFKRDMKTVSDSVLAVVAGVSSIATNLKTAADEASHFSNTVDSVGASLDDLIKKTDTFKKGIEGVGGTKSLDVKLNVDSTELDGLTKKFASAATEDGKLPISVKVDDAEFVAFQSKLDQVAKTKIVIAISASGELADIEKKLEELSKKQVKVQVTPAGSSSSLFDDFEDELDAFTAKATPSSKGASKTMSKSSLTFMEELQKKTRAAEAEIFGMEDDLDDLDKKKHFIGLNIDMSKMKAFQDFVKKDLSVAEVEMLNASLAAKGFDKTLETLGATTGKAEMLQKRLSKAQVDGAKAAIQEAQSYSRFSGEVEDQAKSLKDVVGSAFGDGRREAEEFAKGLNVSAVGMMGAGTAAYFLLKKMDDLIIRFKGSAVGLAKYRVETAALSSTIKGFSKTSLEEMRKGLSLTREQADAFFATVKDGVSSLGMTKAQIMEVSKALQATFGGDQTKRLQDYVDLVKEMPSIQTDLQVNANFDDQSAALFALAESGKVSAVMDLQSAGLMGGEKESFDGKALLDSNQKTEATMGDIQDTLVSKFFPAIAPPLAGIFEGVTTLGSAIAGGIAAIGGLQFFFGRKTDIQTMALERAVGYTTKSVGSSGKAIVMAINRQSLASGKISKVPLPKGVAKSAEQLELFPPPLPGTGGAVKGGATQLEMFPGLRSLAPGATPPPLPGMTPPPLPAPAGATGLGGRSMELLGKTTAAASKNVGALAKVAGMSVRALNVVSLVGAAVSIAFEVAGSAAQKLASSMEDDSKYLEAGLTRMGGAVLTATGSIAGMALAGAAIGTLFGGPVGTAIGAGVGAFIGGLMSVGDVLTNFSKGVEDVGKGLQETVTFDGKPIQKFNDSVVAVGSVLEKFGSDAQEWLSDFGDALYKNTVGLWKSLTGWQKFEVGLMLVAPALGGLVIAATKVGEELALAFSSDEYKAGFKVAGDIAKQMAVEWKKVEEQDKKYGKKIQVRQKALMKSTQALELQMTKTKNQFQGLKYRLFEAQQELGKADFTQLRDIGGSAAYFSGSVKRMSDSVGKEFEMMVRDLNERRSEILKDGDLNGVQRQQALEDLHRHELTAVSKFVAGMREVTDALLATPSIIQAGLQAELKKAKFGFARETGAVSREEGGKMADSQMADYRKKLDETMTAAEAVQGKVADGQAKASKMQEDAIKSLVSEADKLPELKDVFKKNEKGDKTVDTGKAKEAYDKATKEFEELSKKSDELMEKILPTTVSHLAGSVADSIDAEKKSVARIKSLNEELSKLRNDTSAEATKKATEVEKSLQEEATAYKNIQDSTSRQQKRLAHAIQAAYKNQKKVISEEKAESVAKDVSMVASKGGKMSASEVAGSLTNQKDVNDALAALGALEGKSGDVILKELEAVENAQKAAGKVVGALQPVVETFDTMTSDLQNQLKAQQAVDQAARAYVAAARELYAINSGETQDAQRRLAELQQQLKFAGLIGDSMKAFTAATHQQTKLVENQVKDWEASIAKIDAQIADRKSKLSKGGLSEQEVTDTEGAIKGLEQVKSEFQSKMEEVVGSMGMVGDMFSKALDQLDKDLSGTKLKATAGLADSLNELAEFSSNVAGTTKEAFEMGAKAAEENYQRQKVAIDKIAKEEQDLADKRIAMARKSGASEADLAKMKQDQDSVISATKKSNLARKEVEYKQRVVALAEAEVRARTEEAQLRQDSIEAEIDYISYMGGSWRRIVELQGQSLAMEQEKYNIAQDEVNQLKQNGVTGLALLRAETKARQQWYALQKAAVGIQKDIVEKIMGAAFGMIRGEAGGQTQRDTIQSLLGVEATRVHLKAGGVAGVEGGGAPGTIEERSIKRQLDAWGSAREGGGTGDENVKPEDIPAKQLESEKKMAVHTKDTADATGEMRDAALHKGSLYTHDDIAHGYFAQMVDSLMSIASSLAGGTASGGVAKATPAVPEANLLENIMGGDLKKEISGVANQILNEKASQKVAADNALKESKKTTQATTESSGSTDVVAATLDEQLEVDKKHLRQVMKTWRETKHNTKESLALENEAKGLLSKIKTNQDSQRVREIATPWAGSGPETMGADYEHIMKGQLSDEVKADFKEISQNNDKGSDKGSEGSAKGVDKVQKLLDNSQKKLELQDRKKMAASPEVQAAQKKAQALDKKYQEVKKKYNNPDNPDDPGVKKAREDLTDALIALHKTEERAVKGPKAAPKYVSDFDKEKANKERVSKLQQASRAKFDEIQKKQAAFAPSARKGVIGIGSARPGVIGLGSKPGITGLGGSRPGVAGMGIDPMAQATYEKNKAQMLAAKGGTAPLTKTATGTDQLVPAGKKTSVPSADAMQSASASMRNAEQARTLQPTGAAGASFAAAGNPGGSAGASSSGSATMNLKGTLQISFKENFATLVAEVVNTSEVREAISKNFLTRSM